MEAFISQQSLLVVILILAVVLLSYFIPTIIAKVRGHLNLIPIFLVNLLLGWSFLGWIGALIWSFTSNTKANMYRR